MRWLRNTVVMLCILGTWGQLSIASNGEDTGVTPCLNHGRKWRIGYYEGGAYIEYRKNLTALVRALMDMGWIQPAEIPVRKGEETTGLWKWLSEDARSDYLVFVGNAHYSAGWDKSTRRALSKKLLERLNGAKDIDLMIAMGTNAGQDLANSRHKVPTIVLSTSDPLSAGIIKSTDDSGLGHVTARVDPHRYARQIQVFHDVIGFQRLGVPYEDTVTGRSYAAIDQIREVAAERGFDIVPCFTRSDAAEKEAAEKSVIDCFRELAGQVDAIYVTQQKGVNVGTISRLARIAATAGIPTFSQAGSDEVRAGILLSISNADYRYVGRFYAENIARIFNGARPRDLAMIFEDPPKIAINLKTARQIGFDPPVDVLGVADEIFTK